MSYTYTWTCDLTTYVSGNLSRLEPSQETHSMNSKLPLRLLQKVCNCASIDATFSTNLDRTTRITLVNNGSSAVLQSVKLSVISSIIDRAVLKKSPEQIKAAAENAGLQKVISWKIDDFSGESPGQALCLVIYTRKDLTYLPVTSLDRIETTEYHKMMRDFRDSLK